MSMPIETFKMEYAKAIQNEQAAIFAGAGISQPLGIPTWKNIMMPLAKKLQIEISDETDLTQIAQYYVNENNGRRTELEEHFRKEIDRNIILKEDSLINHLVDLKISSYWTTNYDLTFERYFDKKNIKYSKIAEPNVFTVVSNSMNKLLYKMHGDIFSKMVITKEDYELYERSYEPFLIALKNELMQKHFAFVGFSFNDPNLEHILGDMKKMFGNSYLKKHYCFFKVPEDKNKKIELQLKIRDLERYGIETVLLNDFSQLNEIFLDIKKINSAKNIFISGSAFEYGKWDQESAKKFLELLGESLIEKGYKIYSAFGDNVGEYILKGAIKALSNKKDCSLKEYVEYLAFPRHEIISIEEQERFRREIIQECGWSIFVFGNRKDTRNSPGVMQEYYISKEFKKNIIPIKSTGFATEAIWNSAVKSKQYQYLKKYGKVLRDSRDAELLVSTILNVLEETI